ncbi:MAG TPA: hypothetical protein ENL20_07800, partial [Candidatus Cloacimonetes bacterium]|nr:hypothetical protein [Candidatus Cloacimonadota bacterium]
MYPFNFEPDEFWIGSKHFFIAMPFNDKCKCLFNELIEPAIKKYNDSSGIEYSPWKADLDITTKIGWDTILQKLYSARLIIGVLTDHNPNVYYEIGIA